MAAERWDETRVRQLIDAAIALSGVPDSRPYRKPREFRLHEVLEELQAMLDDVRAASSTFGVVRATSLAELAARVRDRSRKTRAPVDVAGALLWWLLQRAEADQRVDGLRDAREAVDPAAVTPLANDVRDLCSAYLDGTLSDEQLSEILSKPHARH